MVEDMLTIIEVHQTGFGLCFVTLLTIEHANNPGDGLIV